MHIRNRFFRLVDDGKPFSINRALIARQGENLSRCTEAVKLDSRLNSWSRLHGDVENRGSQPFVAQANAHFLNLIYLFFCRYLFRRIKNSGSQLGANLLWRAVLVLGKHR